MDDYDKEAEVNNESDEVNNESEVIFLRKLLYKCCDSLSKQILIRETRGGEWIPYDVDPQLFAWRDILRCANSLVWGFDVSSVMLIRMLTDCATAFAEGAQGGYLPDCDVWYQVIDAIYYRYPLLDGGVSDE